MSALHVATVIMSCITSLTAVMLVMDLLPAWVYVRRNRLNPDWSSLSLYRENIKGVKNAHSLPRTFVFCWMFLILFMVFFQTESVHGILSIIMTLGVLVSIVCFYATGRWSDVLDMRIDSAMYYYHERRV